MSLQPVNTCDYPRYNNNQSTNKDALSCYKKQRNIQTAKNAATSAAMSFGLSSALTFILNRGRTPDKLLKPCLKNGGIAAGVSFLFSLIIDITKMATEKSKLEKETKEVKEQLCAKCHQG